MSLSKRGYLILFIGIILLSIAFFASTNLSFNLWAALFFSSMLLSAIGIIMLIVDLVKQIKQKS